MSYNTRLQTANTDLQGLIDKANALPDAGGASVETCTVTIDSSLAEHIHTNESGIYYAEVYCTCLNNGTICWKTGTLSANSGTDLVLNNVVLNTYLLIYDIGTASFTVDSDTGESCYEFGGGYPDYIAAFCISGNTTISC